MMMNSKRRKGQQSYAKKKWLLIVLIILGIFIALNRFDLLPEQGAEYTEVFEISDKLTLADLKLTRHAQCRMDCRHIDKEEILEVLQQKKQNKKKTRKDERGFTYAFEGLSRDNQYIRVIIAPDKEKLVVVTVIDIDKNWSCDCD